MLSPDGKTRFVFQWASSPTECDEGSRSSSMEEIRHSGSLRPRFANARRGEEKLFRRTMYVMHLTAILVLFNIYFASALKALSMKLFGTAS